MRRSNISEGRLKELLRPIVEDPQRLILGKDIEPRYLCDSLEKIKGEADAMVFVKAAHEVSRILKIASEHNIPVTPRGAGTGLIGASVPTGGILLDFSRMNSILEFDEESMTVTVEPGILLKDLQEYVEARGLFYPPDPGEKASSIGGNISTNAGGMRAVKYGTTRDYVRGLEIVTADGDILQAGSKNVKDSSGLSIKNLVTGAEGTLAVITKCLLRLVPKPEFALSVLIPFEDLSSGIKSVLRFLRSGIAPTALEFLERRIVKLGEDFLNIRFPGQGAGSYILTTFDGSRGEVQSKVERMRKLALENGALDFIVLDDREQSQKIWELRGSLAKAVNALSAEWEPVDIVVPINRTADFVEYVNQLEQRSGMKMYSCGHAGDGNVHLWVLREDRDDGTWQDELHKNMDDLYAKAYEMGGLTSGEHGIGLSKRRYFLNSTPRENLLFMNRVKDALDPKHILNDGKAYLLP